MLLVSVLLLVCRKERVPSDQRGACFITGAVPTARQEAAAARQGFPVRQTAGQAVAFRDVGDGDPAAQGAQITAPDRKQQRQHEGQG